MMNADGTGEPARLTSKEQYQVPTSWSPDGDDLVFVERVYSSDDRSNAHDIWTVSVTDACDPRAILRDPHNKQDPTISHDGRWLAYASDESGQEEVYVRPYGREGPRVQISADGGSEPAWAPDDRRLYYVAPRRRMMVVGVTGGDTLNPGAAETLFELPSGFFRTIHPGRAYDLSPDGTRFLASTVLSGETPATPPATDFKVILNWHEDLLERVPIP